MNIFTSRAWRTAEQQVERIYEGAKPMDDWKPDPRTVQACIDLIPEDLSVAAYNLTRDTLARLIPKPDPAKALVEEYNSSGYQEAGEIFDPEKYTRWLIDNDRIKPKGGE